MGLSDSDFSCASLLHISVFLGALQNDHTLQSAVICMIDYWSIMQVIWVTNVNNNYVIVICCVTSWQYTIKLVSILPSFCSWMMPFLQFTKRNKSEFIYHKFSYGGPSPWLLILWFLELHSTFLMMVSSLN